MKLQSEPAVHGAREARPAVRARREHGFFEFTTIATGARAGLERYDRRGEWTARRRPLLRVAAGALPVARLAEILRRGGVAVGLEGGAWRARGETQVQIRRIQSMAG